MKNLFLFLLCLFGLSAMAEDNALLFMQAKYGLPYPLTNTSSLSLGLSSGGYNAFFNAAFGAYALHTDTTGINDSAFGYASLTANTTGNNNTAIGNQAGIALTSGSGNTFLGQGAGLNYTTEANNITIYNVGIAGDSGVIRIGAPGVQLRTYLSGQVYVQSIFSTNYQTNLALANAAFIYGDANGRLSVGTTLPVSVLPSQANISVATATNALNLGGVGAANFLTNNQSTPTTLNDMLQINEATGATVIQGDSGSDDILQLKAFNGTPLFKFEANGNFYGGLAGATGLPFTGLTGQIASSQVPSGLSLSNLNLYGIQTMPVLGANTNTYFMAGGSSGAFHIWGAPSNSYAFEFDAPTNKLGGAGRVKDTNGVWNFNIDSQDGVAIGTPFAGAGNLAATNAVNANYGSFSNGLNSAGKFTNTTLTASALAMTDANKALQSVTLGTGLSFSGSTLNATASGGGSFFDPTQFGTNSASQVNFASGAATTNLIVAGNLTYKTPFNWTSNFGTVTDTHYYTNTFTNSQQLGVPCRVYVVFTNVASTGFSVQGVFVFDTNAINGGTATAPVCILTNYCGAYQGSGAPFGMQFDLNYGGFFAFTNTQGGTGSQVQSCVAMIGVP